MSPLPTPWIRTLISDVGPALLARWPRLPRRCHLCQQWSAQALCPACVQRFAPARARCPRCALPQPSGAVCGGCLRDPPPFIATRTLGDYGFPWDRLITALKFHQQPELAALLAPLLARAVQLTALQPEAEAILPVPLSPQRLAERGYNQAWELARRLAPGLPQPARPQWLQRLRDTPHQVGLARDERLRNLRHAFWVPPEAETHVRGRHLALVDDVMTTGMTARACARTLLDAGAASVQVWVLARTPAPDDTD